MHRYDAPVGVGAEPLEGAKETVGAALPMPPVASAANGLARDGEVRALG
jgi:hypothetical protein